MFRVILLIAILCVALGFAPSARRSAHTSLSMAKEGFSESVPFLLKPKNLEGMVGNADFDPVGFAEVYDPKWLREAEIKHGRVSMLAVVGFLTQQVGVHFPGSLYETKNPIDAFFTVLHSDYAFNPIAQIFLGIGVLEWINHDGKVTMEDMHTNTDREVGEFKAPFYGAKRLKGKSAEYIADMKTKELNNGRLAMCAIGGMIHHQIIAGTEVFGAFPNPHLFEGLATNIPWLYHN